MRRSARKRARRKCCCSRTFARPSMCGESTVVLTLYPAHPRYVPDASKAVFEMLKAMTDRKAANNVEPSSAFERTITDDIKAKKFTAKSFAAKLSELVDTELSKAEDQDIFDKEKKQGISANEQDIFIRAMQDGKFDWSKGVDLGKTVFVPAAKCVEASKFRELTEEEKKLRVVEEVPPPKSDPMEVS